MSSSAAKSKKLTKKSKLDQHRADKATKTKAKQVKKAKKAPTSFGEPEYANTELHIKTKAATRKKKVRQQLTPTRFERIVARTTGLREATAEFQRLELAHKKATPWQRWGTYVSERAWGTVREDYSADGDAWNYFPYDAARSRAFRWNEDALAGWCDAAQTLVFGIGLWNGLDDHIKERPYGLTNEQGNHGEDVKDYWFYLDNTPTHSYAHMRYKYPQVAFPYQDLLHTNQNRSTTEPEYELFDALEQAWRANRYFDVDVEYAKVDCEDMVCSITVTNRGPEAAEITVAAQMWYRNTWSWEVDQSGPSIELARNGVTTHHPHIGRRWYYATTSDGSNVTWLFCDNETNNERVFGSENTTSYPKDAINDAIVSGNYDLANAGSGSKAAAIATVTIPGGGVWRMTTKFSSVELDDPFEVAHELVALRKDEADEFYRSWVNQENSADAIMVQRQAFAGLLWCKQFYNYHIRRWLEGDPTAPPPPPERYQGRNHHWMHLINEDVLLMPDAWEYPWYAAWDMGFHCVTMAMIDPTFAKSQLLTMLSSLYQHPHGSVPAYEWNFNDTNPPVLAWAAWQTYQIDAVITGKADIAFLASAFRNMLSCLTNWLVTEDATGTDIYGGGFLGMDNIGIFNRDEPLPTGGQLVQSDGTAWVAQMVIQMAQMALELSRHQRGYTNDIEKLLLDFSIVTNVLEHGRDGVSLWNEDTGFYCDAIVFPEGGSTQLGVISLQAVVPLLAVASVPVRGQRMANGSTLQQGVHELRMKVLQHHPEYRGSVALAPEDGNGNSMLFAVVKPERLRRMLAHLLDPNEMLSDFGIRSLSARYRANPYTFDVHGQRFELPYWPAESQDRMFGGNSNWRGPIWFPINMMVIQSLLEYDHFLGDTFTVEFPTGSSNQLTLGQVARALSDRLCSLFLRNDDGERVVNGDNDYFQHDPNWRDLVPFYEYFDGDTGRGCGASHQTGWTAVVGLLLQFGGSPAKVQPPVV